MEKLVDEGLAKAIGVSNFTKQQLKRIYDNARIKPSNLQVTLFYIFHAYTHSIKVHGSILNSYHYLAWGSKKVNDSREFEPAVLKI